MIPDSLDDGAVVEEDEDHGEEVVEDAHEHDVAPVVQVVTHVVVAAGHQHALDGVATPDACQNALSR